MGRIANIFILLELLAVWWQVSMTLWKLSFEPDIRNLKTEF